MPAFTKIRASDQLTVDDDFSMNGHRLRNLPVPVIPDEAANKAYVDSVAGGAGAQGNQGFRGFQGFQGFSGVNGVQGNQGNQGLSAAGVQGPQGFVGAQGNQGTQGALSNDIFAATRVVDPGGAGTDTTIAAAITALPAAGGDIYIKGGASYAIASPLDFTTKVVRIHGAGTSVNFTTGPTTLTPAAGISLFKNGAQGSSVEDLTVEGDNTSSQVFYEGAAEVRFARINVHDVAGIIKGVSQPEITFKDSYINVPSGVSIPLSSRYLWNSNSANGKLIFDNVELFITGSGATIMSGITAGANGPEFKVVNSYVGGGGGGGATNFWFAQVIEWDSFLIDTAQFEISGARNFITNCGFLDFSIKFKAVWNFISNSNFSQGGTGSGLATSQVEFAAPNAGIMAESIVTGCNFYGNFVSLTGVTVTNTFPIEISGCIFSNHTVQGVFWSGGTVPNASKGSVIGCRFTESVPVTEGGTDVVVRYAGNEGFDGSVIVGPDSTVEGVRRKSVIGGTTTAVLVQVFTHKNSKGLTGIGTIKNTGGVNSVDVKESVTDAFGTSDSQTNTVAPAADRPLNPAVNIGTARPPYVSYKVEVIDTVGGSHTTYNLQHASDGAA